MFEVALELGIRRGELLKRRRRVDSLPRGAGDGILILRRPDDPNDSHAHEPLHTSRGYCEDCELMTAHY
jgi:hypothetical protein